MINIDKVAYKEVNFKSKLIEWSQKNRVKLDFAVKEQGKDKNGSPFFLFCVELEGIEGCCGRGYSKKESQQLASKLTLERLKKEPQFIDQVFVAKAVRVKAEELDEKGDNVSTQTLTVEKGKNASQTLATDVTLAQNELQTTLKGAQNNDTNSSDATSELTTERNNESQEPTVKHPTKLANGVKGNEAEKQQTKNQEREANNKAEEKELEVYRDDAPKDEPAEKQQSLYVKRDEEEDVATVLDFDDDPEFDLSHITARQQSREEIIAAAEAAAFNDEHTDNQNQ